MLFRFREIALLDESARQQLVRFARVRRHRDLGVRNRLFRISRFQVRESESEREVGRENFRLRDCRFVSLDRFAVTPGIDEDLAKLRPDILQMRIAREKRAECRNRFVVAAFVGEMKGSLDLLQMADLVARIGKRPAAIARRSDVAERGQLLRLFRIDRLHRINC